MAETYAKLVPANGVSTPVPPVPTVPALPAVQDAGRGAVAPSLSAAVDWVRRAAKSRGRVQVLVTGSLYLVGDMLRMLGKAPK